VLVVVGLLAALALGLALALGAGRLLLGDDDSPGPSDAPTEGGSASPTDPAASREQAVEGLLDQRARAVTGGDRDLFLDTVDPGDADFFDRQAELFDRVTGLDLAAWGYQVTGDGPGLPAARAGSLPRGSTIVRVRLTYRLAGTETTTDREQYLTVVPRGGRWLVAGDTDGSANGFDTQRDLWDLGPVRSIRGDSSLVLADTRGASRAQMRRLAEEADLAVRDVGEVWTEEWSRVPVVILPRSQQDMATLIGSDGEGLAQIAAVTTGSFESGLSRGDRIVINPAAWDSLGELGRRVVIAHEMTHVATRASSVQTVPIWLSEGFADYVAYRATPVPTVIVASDVFDDVRDGHAPRKLPDDADFDASRGDVAASYEAAWLACRMIAERYGEKRLVRFYRAMSDSAGPGWPEETAAALGISRADLVRDWKAYLREKAAS
jgi:hypothetical protein